MKKYLCITLFMLLLLCSCIRGGDISDVKTKSVDSKLYSQEDITSAIDTIKNEFGKEWGGCTLTEIYYAGDEDTADYQDWADRYNADEVILLLSSFDVDSSGGDGSFNSNSTYENWMWILVRTDGGSWKHVDHGY